VTGSRRWGVEALIVVAATLAAAGMRWTLDPWLGSEAPLLTFVASVLAAAWLAGQRAALLATLLGLAAGSWLFLEPRFAYAAPDGVAATRMLAFGAVGVGLAVLVPKLERAARIAQQGYDEFRAIFENSSAGLSQVDIASNRLVRVNHAFCRILGYTAEQLTRIPPGDLTHPDDRARSLECIDALLRGDIREYSIEKRYLHRDGHPVWVQVTVNGIRDGSGRIVRTSALVQDIGERQRIAEEREALLVSERRAREDAEHANRSKDEFVATLSHELRTPLNAILGWVQVLRRGRLDAETVAQGLAVIERNARVQTQLIADLLDVNRIVSGKIRLEPGPVRLQSVVGAAIESLAPVAQAKRITLETSIDPSIPPIVGDAARLQQVVLNLLTNAVKFTPSGGRISVNLEGRAAEARIRVVDNGEGIAPAFLPMLFERYRQAEEGSMRQYGGLGLGLSIVRHLTELHGGRVEAASGGPGTGATFTVTLPLRASTDAPEVRGELPDPRREPQERPDLHGIRVLTVDDDPDAREVIGRMLEAFGAEVTSAASARDALAALRRSVPDVLVCDIGMPHQDGYALIAAVRGLPLGGGAPLPAIALTAYARAQDRERALASGFQAHLAKPVDAARLAGTIATLCPARARGTGEPQPVG
jgi:PAS domain S-box-containing protein